MGQSCKLTNSFRVLGTGKWNEMNEKKKKKTLSLCPLDINLVYAILKPKSFI